MTAIVTKQASKVLYRATSRGLERGMRGNGIWLAFGIIGGGLRALGYLKRRNEVVYRAVIAPGQRIEIDHFAETFKQLGTKPVG